MKNRPPIQKLKRADSEIETGKALLVSEIETGRFKFENENGDLLNSAVSDLKHPYISSHRHVVFSATVLSTPYREPKGTQRKYHEVPT